MPRSRMHWRELRNNVVSVGSHVKVRAIVFPVLFHRTAASGSMPADVAFAARIQ